MAGPLWPPRGEAAWGCLLGSIGRWQETPLDEAGWRPAGFGERLGEGPWGGGEAWGLEIMIEIAVIVEISAVIAIRASS